MSIIQARQWRNFDVPPALWSALDRRGKEYVAIPRPKGYRRQQSKGCCFLNAATIATRDINATYVEGIAWSPRSRCGVHHAWITLDDEHAIDQTWQYDPGTIYVGIAVPSADLRRIFIRGEYRGDPVFQ